MATENGPVVTRSAADFRMMRETLGLAQAWVARTVGVTTLTVVHWEDPREFALPRREAWDLVEGMWAEADRRATAFVDMASKATALALDNGIEPEPVMLSYWRDPKDHRIVHRDEDVIIAGFHLSSGGMMRLENAACRMAVDRLHTLGVPLTVMYAEVEA
ncbi:hypothetical protein [Bifidobacterium adolescentis]|uniref:hypothetical protein n=1 Tax=Bifidobacterium adolescentis TaxID=1680 RepID=UPI00359C61FA